MKNVFVIFHLLISILVSFQTSAQNAEKPLPGNWLPINKESNNDKKVITL
jgi:hypothetical protein